MTLLGRIEGNKPGEKKWLFTSAVRFYFTDYQGMKYWICIMIPAHIELVGGFIFFKVSPRFLLNDPIWLICSKGWNHQLVSVVPFFPLVICYGFHGSLLISGYAKELNWCINWGRYISRFSSFWAYFLKVVPMVFVLDVLILSVYFMKFRENYNIDNIYIYISRRVFSDKRICEGHVWFEYLSHLWQTLATNQWVFFLFSAMVDRCCRRHGIGRWIRWKMYLLNSEFFEAGRLGSFKGHDMAWYYLERPIIAYVII